MIRWPWSKARRFANPCPGSGKQPQTGAFFDGAFTTEYDDTPWGICPFCEKPVRLRKRTTKRGERGTLHAHSLHRPLTLVERILWGWR